MPKKGDNYTVTLIETYIKWGEYRHTDSRERIINEVYLPIPAPMAREYNIYNSNKEDANTEYKVSTADKFKIDGLLLAQGSSNKGDIYAKNLSGLGNLKLLGPWMTHIKANIGDKIKIEWTSPTDILLTKV